MAAKTKHSTDGHSPTSKLAGWARQGIDSFMAAQKILLDLTAQQNALVIGMIRERMSEPGFWPGNAIFAIADKSIENFSAAGKILLDLAADGTELVFTGIKDSVPLPVVAGTMANLIRHRVATLIELEQRLLEVAAEQTHEAAETYREGKGLMATGASAAELVRRSIENLVETEKKFLDLAIHEVSASKDHRPDHKQGADRYKTMTELVREGGEKYIDAQQKLLNLAVEQMGAAGKTASKRLESVRTGTRTSWGELSEKSVHNFATAQKSLMELVVKPEKAAATATPHERKRKPIHHARPSATVEVHERKSA